MTRAFGAVAETQPPISVFRAGLGRSVPLGSIRVGPATELRAVLRQFGIDLVTLLDEFGIPIDLFDDPDNTIPYPAFCRLISRCTELTGRDDLGLLVCEVVGPSNLGLLGFLLQQAPDLRIALSDLVTYFHHHDRGAAPFVRTRNGVAVLGYALFEPSMAATEQIYDGAIAIARNILVALCGPKWRPIEVTLSRRRPFSTARYESFFGAPVRFDAEQSAIFFHETWLSTPIPRADPALRRMLQEQVTLLEREEDGNISEQVRRLVRASLLTSSLSLEGVCQLLRMNQRTLARRLEAEATNFKEISDAVHFSVARHFLLHTSMSIMQVSLALGYSEASAFTRAFRNWSGESPSKWRELQRAGSARETETA